MKRILTVVFFIVVLSVVTFIIIKEQTGVPDQNNFGNIAEKADLIKIASLSANQEIKSPITITGEARGYWFFEAVLPVIIIDKEGNVLGQGVATAQDDWMTTDFVSFTATVSFNKFKFASDGAKSGAIIFQKSNQSGLPENDDALEFPITFK
ncbi:MAG TPA: Gmad2 immunoglobulin-like domain-containing protein [Candidatus Paceibacterota bacterium]|nr:Gmad2 immunoglobulin-like domain-containing protein [Candidatus Paceibacterota bacterium]HRZ34423.1 Gmad2 immunoglobulin-like domain-containing protein [Candidatus Paceibacterota bacterium]